MWRAAVRGSPARAAQGPWRQLSGRADGASWHCGRRGHPAALGPRPYFCGSPGRLEVRGGRLGPAMPRSPCPGLGSGVAGYVKTGLAAAPVPFAFVPGGAERAFLPRALRAHPGGKQRTLVCKQLCFPVPWTESCGATPWVGSGEY